MPAPRAPNQLISPAPDFSDPITKVYADVSDQIMVNVARHFSTGKNLGSLDWQLQKMAEVGKLQKENLLIIQKMTGDNSETLSYLLERAAMQALTRLEPEFMSAVFRGYLNATPITMAESVKRTLQAYQMQAIERLNLVNTAMLKSSLIAYRSVVSDTLMYEKQLEAAQQTLNSVTGEVITGVSSRQEALRKAVVKMLDSGLSGFTDRAMRNWTPEAYVNMDVRTTAGNVANQAIFSRNAEYGNDLIWVRVNGTAREGCYPFQGKVYSTGGRSGEVEDLDGNKIKFDSLYSTTYGQAAGIFGINCHHSPPNPFIPGMSKIRGDVPDKKENDRKYEQSQEQRQLERAVRYGKRNVAAAKAINDPKLLADESNKLFRAQGKLNAFIEKTGRTARPDRTQIFQKTGTPRSITRPVKPKALEPKKQSEKNSDTDAVEVEVKPPPTFKTVSEKIPKKK
ncbi:MAG: phage minor capsid protein [Eubacteriales bacterium]